MREVLMSDWDPIGVAGFPEFADKYDGYVGTVYVMLMDQRATREQIAAYLVDVATNHMGISARAFVAERSDNAAAALVSMRPEFETH